MDQPGQVLTNQLFPIFSTSSLNSEAKENQLKPWKEKKKQLKKREKSIEHTRRSRQVHNKVTAWGYTLKGDQRNISTEQNEG